MDFKACLAITEAMSGELVEVQIWGTEARSRTMASFTGVIEPMGEVELPPGFPQEAVGETAVTFVIGAGSAYLTLWPSRFVGAEMWKHPPDWLEVRTCDGRVVLGPKRPAWVD